MNEALARLAVLVYTVTLPLSWIAFALCVLVLGPMALFRTTRVKAGAGLYIASWIFGLTTWTLGAALTFGTFGWLGLVFGLVVAGVGVVPIGIVAAFMIGVPHVGVWLIVMSAIVFAARWGGLILTSLEDER